MKKYRNILLILLLIVIFCSLFYKCSTIENMDNNDQIITGFYNWTWNSTDPCNSGSGNPTEKHNIGIIVIFILFSLVVYWWLSIN